MIQIFLILFLGIFTGVASGLLGIGGGVIMVPVFSYVFKMSFPQAIGTSLAVMVPLAFVGSLTHFMNGNVDLRSTLFFALAAIVGGWLGASLAPHLPVSILKKLFAFFLVFVAFNLFFKG